MHEQKDFFKQNYMTTTAQDALKTYEGNWKKQSSLAAFNVATAANRAAYLCQWMEKKMAAAIEIESNRIEEEAAQATADANRKALYISKLKSKGFACDNSTADWYKLYNRPHIFGEHWQTQADYQISISTGVDYFLQKVVELWWEYVKD